MNSPELLNSARAVRAYAHSVIEGLSDEQMLAIPRGASNNILWNLGHVITDEVNMLYTPSGLDSPLPQEYHALFDPGTSPSDWGTPPDPRVVVEHSREMGKRLVENCEAGRFDTFTRCELDDNVWLTSIEQALAHNTIHDAVHTGVMLTLRRLVSG